MNSGEERQMLPKLNNKTRVNSDAAALAVAEQVAAGNFKGIALLEFTRGVFTILGGNHFDSNGEMEEAVKLWGNLLPEGREKALGVQIRVQKSSAAYAEWNETFTAAEKGSTVNVGKGFLRRPDPRRPDPYGRLTMVLE